MFVQYSSQIFSFSKFEITDTVLLREGCIDDATRSDEAQYNEK